MHLECVKKLLRCADFNLKSVKSGHAPLHYALTNWYYEHFVLPCVGQHSFDNEFHRKYLDCRAEMVQVLLDGRANVNIQDPNKNTPLHRSVSGGYYHCPIITLLLEHNADTEIRNQEGLMPLHIAARHPIDFFGGLRLLQYGADLRARTPEGDTALSLAKSECTAKTIRMIRKKKIAENKLFLACMGFNYRLVSKLIAGNVDLNQTDAEGETPLMYVAHQTGFALNLEEGKTAKNIIRQLLDAKADPLIEADDGTTVLSLTSGEVKEMFRNFILAEERKKLFEVLFKIFEQVFPGESGFEPGLIELILKLAETYEPI